MTATHWDGCWNQHHDCALLHIAWLQLEVEAALDLEETRAQQVAQLRAQHKETTG